MRVARIPDQLYVRPAAMFLPRSILVAWAMRGLLMAPSAGQVAVLAPLVREPTGGVAAAAIAAMEGIPPVGSTYALVRAMLTAAREELTRIRKRLHSGIGLHTDVVTDTRDPGGGNEETSRIGGAGGDLGPAPRRHPIGLAAWRALREPGGALYRRAGDQLSDAAAERMERQRLLLRELRAARRRSVP